MNIRLAVAVFVMGFTSLAAQTILIREFFIVYNGNEFTIGIVLASWILLVALGAFAGERPALTSRSPATAYALFQVGLAAYLPLALVLIRSAKSLIGADVGESMGLSAILISSLIIPSLLGILTGAEFPFACRIASDLAGRSSGAPARVYTLDAVGFIVAGPVVTYLCITRLDACTATVILGGINALSALAVATISRPRRADRAIAVMAAIAACGAAALVFSGLTATVNERSLTFQWQKRHLVRYENSPYGNLAVTEQSGQYTFYANGTPIMTTPLGDRASAEELVHFGMLSAPDPKRVLLIGGGSDVMHEIVKYPIEKLTYVELDPAMIRLIRDLPESLTAGVFRDKRLEIVAMDGRRFLNLTRTRYDVVILNLPMPSTLEVNRFYTAEFFRSVAAHSTDDGILILSLPGSLTYLDPELRKLNRSVMDALEGSFSVTVIPGATNRYIASRKEATLTAGLLEERLEERRVGTRTLNAPYIEDRFDPEKAAWFIRSIGKRSTVRTNTDLTPVATYYALSSWNELFSPRLYTYFKKLDRITFAHLAGIIAVAGLLLCFTVMALKRPERGAAGAAIFTTGFTGMSLNLIIVYAYQSFYGFVFSHIALLFAACMAGVAAGSWTTRNPRSGRRRDLESLAYLESVSFFLCLGIAAVMTGLALYAPLRIPLLFVIAAIAAGFPVGAAFPVANRIFSCEEESGRASGGMLYAIDLTGSWLAALTVSAIIVPLIGIFEASLLLATLKITSIAALAIAARRVRAT